MQDRLEMLIALVREKHFGRAAETLGITQPSLSFGIRALEEQLGAPLVRRGSRYQGLTAEGERVYERALRIVAETRALKDDVRGAGGELTGLIRFGVVPTALPLAAELVAATQERHPESALPHPFENGLGDSGRADASGTGGGSLLPERRGGPWFPHRADP